MELGILTYDVQPFGARSVALGYQIDFSRSYDVIGEVGMLSVQRETGCQ
ncbi:MAG TPA: hypothetical protein VE030_06300 [Burkholderiales bacterium]|jgi:hypothetical protein|nr:hypothetical protein [Burkholderiales bacterium]